MLPHDTHDTHARLSVLESVVNRVDKKVDIIGDNVAQLKTYQDRQRGALAVIVITAGAIGAALTKVAGYLAAKAGIA